MLRSTRMYSTAHVQSELQLNCICRRTLRAAPTTLRRTYCTVHCTRTRTILLQYGVRSSTVVLSASSCRCVHLATQQNRPNYSAKEMCTRVNQSHVPSVQCSAEQQVTESRVYDSNGEIREGSRRGASTSNRSRAAGRAEGETGRVRPDHSNVLYT